MSSDQDLKLGDTLRYYQRDSHAAKALLVRRLRCLAAYEAANRNLEKARSKNKDVHAVSFLRFFFVARHNFCVFLHSHLMQHEFKSSYKFLCDYIASVMMVYREISFSVR